MPLQISDDAMRTLVLDSVSKAAQINQLYPVIERLLVQRGLAADPPQVNRNMPGVHIQQPPFHLDQSDVARVNDIMWDLFIEGITRPGLGDGLNNEWPFFHLTRDGQQVLNGKTPSAFDTDGYLNKITTEVKNTDPVILTYLRESLRTFQIRCYLASTVTLGCAAEKALLLLIEECANSLPAPEDQTFRNKVEPKMMKGKFEEFHKLLGHRIRPKLPKEIDHVLDIQLIGIFDIIRTQRNSAGHPSGADVQQKDASANFYVFPTFLKKVYDLIEWLKANKPI
jgi:hypothetical protein